MSKHLLAGLLAAIVVQAATAQASPSANPADATPENSQQPGRRCSDEMLNRVSLVHEGWKDRTSERPSDAPVRIWTTVDGDAVALLCFAEPWEIPIAPDNVAAIRDWYRKQWAESDRAILEVDVVEILHRPALRQIVKARQPNGGVTYMGIIVVPTADDHFYFLQVTCEEQGVTGIREALVSAEAMQSGRMKIGKDGKITGFGFKDPYDPSLVLKWGMLPSDAREYDDRFPTHPLSRVRRTLDVIQSSLQGVPN